MPGAAITWMSTLPAASLATHWALSVRYRLLGETSRYMRIDADLVLKIKENLSIKCFLNQNECRLSHKTKLLSFNAINKAVDGGLDLD